MRVTFFHANAAAFGPPAQLDPDRLVDRFRLGEQVWVVQTWARLARAGHPVELTDRVPTEGLVVFHVKERRALLAALPPKPRVLLVGIRADNREQGLADVEVVQNGRFADGRRRIFVPSWPQPGLVPRDPARGTTVRRAAFKGFARNLTPFLRSAEWTGFLARHGIEWECDAVQFQRGAASAPGARWHDFSAVDVVVAVRPPDRRGHTNKPASKLVNSWLAGVPAVLGREWAYRELRRTELDYLEADTPEAVKAAVRRLQDEPELYRLMVENGRARSAEFTTDRILETWRRLLFQQLPAYAATATGRRLVRRPVRVRSAMRSLGRVLAGRPAR